MTDATHDASLNDDAFHEIQLSGKQLVFFFMTGTLLLVAVFLLGVQVGRSVKGDRVAEAGDTTASTAVPPPASTPSQSASSSGPPAAEPPAPAQEPQDELSYAKRLQSTSAPPEKLKPVDQAASKPAPAPAAPAASVSTGQPGSWIVQLTALQDRGAASSLAKRLAAKGYPAFVVDPAAGAPAIYRVQVGGYADRREADQVAHRLEKEEQFKPYVRPR